MSLVSLASPVSVPYTHSGDYSSEADARPVVTVEFAATSPAGQLVGATRTGVLLDTGARSTLLGLDIAIRLNLDLSDPRFETRRIGGVVPGAHLRVAETTLLVFLCDRWLQIPVLFSLSPAPVRNLLGREGVFDQVQFSFLHGQRLVYATAS